MRWKIKAAPVIEAALMHAIRLMPSAVSPLVPSIMMPAASVPTVVMAAMAAPPMMPVTMTAPYEDDAVTAREHIWFCDWHRQCR
jgi:hypothetical protein